MKHNRNGPCKLCMAREAAPQLLSALKKIINNWGNLHPKDRQAARRAIKKAEGGKL